MQNDKAKFKDEFKSRIYRFALDAIKFIDVLPKDQAGEVIGTQLLRSTTSIGTNVIAVQVSVPRGVHQLL